MPVVAVLRLSTALLVLTLTLAVLAAGCASGRTSKGGIAPVLPTDNGSQARIAMRNVAAEVGLDFRWPQQPRPMRNLEAFGVGCGFLDYDGDGWQDLVLVARPHPLLYQNTEKGKRFVDVTQAAGLDRVEGSWTGVAAGDADGDGHLDLLFTGYRCLVLLRGNKGGTFVDATAAAGLLPDNRRHWGSSACLSDLDADGDEDLIVLNYVVFNEKEPQYCQLTPGVRSGCPPSRYRPEFGEIWRNEGKGRFKDVSAVAGMKETNGKALVLAQCDVNDDGRPDLYIGNDGTPAELLVNQGRMRFKNLGLVSGLAFGEIPGHSLAAMGADWADFDRDGRLDLAVSAFSDEAYALFKKETGAQFTHLGDSTGLSIATLKPLGFGTKWLDVDNDGWPDLMFANGHVYDRADEIDPLSPYRQPLMLFHNLEGKKVVNLAPQIGGALAAPIVGRGLATGDFDNDGRIDALVADLEGAPLLLHNESKVSGHFLTLDLRRADGKQPALGAKATTHAGKQRWVGQAVSASSYLSTSDPRVHFGLGSVSTVDKVSIRWPSGRTQVVVKPPVDRLLTVTEATGGSPSPSAKALR